MTIIKFSDIISFFTTNPDNGLRGLIYSYSGNFAEFVVALLEYIEQNDVSDFNRFINKQHPVESGIDPAIFDYFWAYSASFSFQGQIMIKSKEVKTIDITSSIGNKKININFNNNLQTNINDYNIINASQWKRVGVQVPPVDYSLLKKAMAKTMLLTNLRFSKPDG
jgi:hypothetical protein